MKRTLHVIQVATTQLDPDLYPYTNHEDRNHNPSIEADRETDELILKAADLFKLKENRQGDPKTRIDIYMPKQSALDLAEDIEQLFGAPLRARRSNKDPQRFNKSEMPVPSITDSYEILIQ